PLKAGCRGVTGPVPRPLSMSAYWGRTVAQGIPPPRRLSEHMTPPASGPPSGSHSGDPEPGPDGLAAAKARLGLRVSVCLPARDEEATVGHIVATVRRALVDGAGLVDEILVLDDGSTDATAEVARWAGATVLAVGDILPELP